MHLIEYPISTSEKCFLSMHGVSQNRATNMLVGTGIRLIPMSLDCPRIDNRVYIPEKQLRVFLKGLHANHGKVLTADAQEAAYLNEVYEDHQFKPNYELVFKNGLVLHIGQEFEVHHVFNLLQGRDLQIDAAVTDFAQSSKTQNVPDPTFSEDIQRNTTIRNKFIFDKVINAGTLTLELIMYAETADNDFVSDDRAKYWATLPCAPVAALPVPAEKQNHTTLKDVLNKQLTTYTLFGFAAAAWVCTTNGRVTGTLVIPNSVYARLDMSRLKAANYIKSCTASVGIVDTTVLQLMATDIEIVHMFLELEQLAFQVTLLTLPPL